MHQPRSLDDLPREAWRNGLGSTRTVLADAAGPDWRWRVSLADLPAGRCAFSRFAGIDRQAALASGTEVMLAIDARTQRLQRLGEVAAFAGEAEVLADCDAGPAQLWNVMTRRSAAAARLLRLDGAGLLPQDGQRVLLALGTRCSLACGTQTLSLRRGEYWIAPAGLPVRYACADGGTEDGLLCTVLPTAA